MMDRYGEMFFHHDGDQTPGQLITECRVSVLRDTQNLIGQSPELSGLSWPSFEHEAGLDDLCASVPNINYFVIHWRISEAVIFYETKKISS